MNGCRDSMDCRWSRIDGAFLVAALAIAIGVSYARGCWRERVIDLTSDAANIASFAAALDHPELFRTDSSLAGEAFQDIYVAFHVPAVRALQRLTSDYGTAFAAMLLPHMVLYLLAFYFLGVTLFSDRPWAMAFAVANLVLIKGPRDTAWGPFKDPLPRMSHAIFFALLFAALWRLRRRPGWWWVLFLAAGLGVYVHPVNTPAMGAMLLVGSLFLFPDEVTWRARLGFTALHAAVFAIAVLPFSVAFLKFSTGAAIASPGHLAMLSAIVEERFTGAYLSPSRTLAEYILSWRLLPIVGLGLAGAAYCLKAGDESVRRLARLWCGMILGLVAAAVAIPIALETLAPGLAFATFKGELPRAFRYVVPLCYVMIVAGAQHWAYPHLITKPRWVRISLVAACSLFLVIGAGPRIARSTLAAMRSGDAGTLETRGLLEAVSRLVPEGEPVAAVMADPLVVRYSALRPLAFAAKDVPSHHDLAEAMRWQERFRKLKEISAVEDDRQRAVRACEWAGILGADYVVVELREGQALIGELPAEILYGNRRYVLLRLSGRQEGVGGGGRARTCLRKGMRGSLPSAVEPRGDLVGHESRFGAHVRGQACNKRITAIQESYGLLPGLLLFAIFWPLQVLDRGRPRVPYSLYVQATKPVNADRGGSSASDAHAAQHAQSR